MQSKAQIAVSFFDFLRFGTDQRLNPHFDREAQNPSFSYGLRRVKDGFPTGKRRVPKS